MTPAPEPRRGGVVDGVAGTVLDGAVSVGSADVLDGKADEDEIDGVTLGCAVPDPEVQPASSAATDTAATPNTNTGRGSLTTATPTL
jgi:hypothetical protein